jgi:hypothetical protein
MNAVVETTQNGALLSFIERAARDETFDVSKFESLLRMQREIGAEQAKREFNQAMANVEGEIGPVLRDRLNPAVNRKYATLEAIDAVARPVYARHGLSVRFGCAPSPTPGWMRITCTVSHAGGYSEQNYLDSPSDLQQGARARSAVQAVGSTITYLRRYLLQMAFNIVLSDDETDDDGEPAARDRQAERVYSQRDRINADIPLTQSAPKMTLREWADDLEARCGAANSPDVAETLLKEERVMKLDDPETPINSDLRTRLLRARSAMVARVWPTPPPEETSDWPELPARQKETA